MKKIYSLFLLAAALICLPGNVKAAAAYYEVDGIRYYGSNASTKNVQVTELSSGKYTGDIVIPGTFEYNSATYTVTGIKDDAFMSCSELTSVTIEEGPTSIGQYSFYGCSNLESVTLPSTISSITYYAFYNCTKLSSITFLGSTPPSTFYAFGNSWPSISGCANDLVIYVPEEAVDAYKTKFNTDIIQPIGGGSACKMPKLNAPTLSFESITITWSAGADETQYQYALGNKGFEPTAWTDVEGTERTLTLNDLSTSNSYDLYIRSYCGAGEGEQSNGAKVNFSPVCPAPTNLEASAVTDATATVSWTAADGISKYQYIYVTSGEPDWSAATVTTETSLDLSSLSASTGYDFYVRSWYSDKSQSVPVKVSFRTACGALSAPWSEDFQSFSYDVVPDCWDNSASTSPTLSTNPYYIWGVYQPYSSDNRMIRMYNYYVKKETGKSNSITLINSPQINIPASPAQELTFDYTHTSTGGDLIVKISDDNGVNFTTLQSYSKGSGTSYSDPGEFTEAGPISLADYAGKTITLQFYALANYDAGAIFIDNISIHNAPNCVKPTDIIVSEITHNSAKIAWTEGDGQTAWKLQTSINNVDWSAEIDADANPFTLTGLSASTPYYVRVKADCSASGDGQSDWSAAATFTTECAPATLPLSENFEGYTTGYGEYHIPDCWTKISSENYPYVNSADAHSGDNSLFFNGQTEKFMLLPLFEAPTNQLSVSLWYNCDADATAELGYYDNGVFTSLLALSTKGVFTEVDELIFSTAPATSHIAIRYVSSSYYAPLNVDDIVVKVAPTCIKPANISATATTDVTATLTWTAGGEESAWNIKYVTANGTDTLTVPANANPFTLTGLSAETNYKAVVQADCGSGDESAWSKDTVVFTTKAACSTPSNLVATSKPDGAVITWEASNGETQFQYRIGEGEWTLLDENTLSVTISELASGTEGTVYVRAYCSEETQSPAASVNFTALCPAPTAPQVSDIAQTTATLSWTAASGITKYQYVVLEKDEAENWDEAKDVEATTVDLDELTANTAYDVYVRSWYSDKSQSASVKVSFLTECAVIATLPWTENFNELTELSQCWATAGASSTISISAGSYVTMELDNNALFFSGEGATYAYALLPEFEAALNTLQIAFAHREESANETQCGKIELGYYKDGAFTALKVCDIVTEMTNVDAFALTDVPEGARIAFAYKAASTKYTAAVDDITVSVKPETPAAIGNTGSETKTVKAIENGQLIIIREGVKYNAQGKQL